MFLRSCCDLDFSHESAENLISWQRENHVAPAHFELTSMALAGSTIEGNLIQSLVGHRYSVHYR